MCSQVDMSGVLAHDRRSPQTRSVAPLSVAPPLLPQLDIQSTYSLQPPQQTQAQSRFPSLSQRQQQVAAFRPLQAPCIAGPKAKFWSHHPLPHLDVLSNSTSDERPLCKSLSPVTDTSARQSFHNKYNRLRQRLDEVLEDNSRLSALLEDAQHQIKQLRNEQDYLINKLAHNPDGIVPLHERHISSSSLSSICAPESHSSAKPPRPSDSASINDAPKLGCCLGSACCSSKHSLGLAGLSEAEQCVIEALPQSAPMSAASSSTRVTSSSSSTAGGSNENALSGQQLLLPRVGLVGQALSPAEYSRQLPSPVVTASRKQFARDSQYSHNLYSPRSFVQCDQETSSSSSTNCTRPARPTGPNKPEYMSMPRTQAGASSRFVNNVCSPSFPSSSSFSSSSSLSLANNRNTTSTLPSSNAHLHPLPHAPARHMYGSAATHSGADRSVSASSGSIAGSEVGYSQQPPVKRRKRHHDIGSKIRSVQPVPRDKYGNYEMPVQVGILTVLNLGKIIWDQDSYHNERYIWPVGYTVQREYYSMKDPDRQVIYTCWITDGGDAPLFHVEAEDMAGSPIVASTATGAWTTVLRAANQIRQREHSNSASGPDYFGFSHPTIAKMIQDLPSADRCRTYIVQHFVEMKDRHVRGVIKKGRGGRPSTEMLSRGQRALMASSSKLPHVEATLDGEKMACSQTTHAFTAQRISVATLTNSDEETARS